MIVTAIHRFFKSVSRLAKRIRRPNLPKVNLPKVKRPKAPHVNTHFLQRILGTAVNAPGINFGGSWKGIKKFFHFATVTHTPGAGKRWYHISPKFFAKVALIVLIPELFLQIISFFAWLHPQSENSPSVLCVSDYDTTYPQVLQEQINKTAPDWKVISVVDHRLDLASAQKVILHYTNSRQIKFIYLTIGSNDVRGMNQKKFIWDDSFEWRWRTPDLALALRGQFHPAIASDQFREESKRSWFEKKFARITNLFHSEEADSGKASDVSATVAKGSQTTQADPKRYDDLVSQKLLLQDVSLSYPTFPGGAWSSSCFTMDFQKDGKLGSGGQLLHWNAEQNHLTITGPARPYDFLWQMEGERLLLMTDLYPIVIVMEKGGPAANNKQALKNLSRAWLRFLAGDLVTSESMLKEIESTCSSPIAAALKARIYYDTGRNEDFKKQVLWLRNAYMQKPDQGLAESLLFSMIGSSEDEKVKTALELLSRYPRSVRLWATVAEYAKEAGNEAASEKAADQALNILPDFLTQTRSMLMRTLARGAFRGQVLMGNDQVVQRNKTFEQLHAVFRLSIKDGDSKTTPKIIFVPYPNNLVMDQALMDIAKGEKADVVELPGMMEIQRDLRNSRNRLSSTAQIPESDVSDAVISDFSSRVKN